MTHLRFYFSFNVLENGSLLITDVLLSDEGKYGCTAGNSGGLKRYEVSLVVRGKICSVQI